MLVNKESITDAARLPLARANVVVCFLSELGKRLQVID